MAIDSLVFKYSIHYSYIFFWIITVCTNGTGSIAAGYGKLYDHGYLERHPGGPLDRGAHLMRMSVLFNLSYFPCGEQQHFFYRV